jgi:hypothetical protein
MNSAVFGGHSPPMRNFRNVGVCFPPLLASRCSKAGLSVNQKNKARTLRAQRLCGEKQYKTDPLLWYSSNHHF